jgi:hypothetical protein
MRWEKNAVEMEGKNMYTRWKEIFRKRKNKWNIITDNKLEAIIRIRDDAPQDRVINERDLSKNGYRRVIGFI